MNSVINTALESVNTDFANCFREEPCKEILKKIDIVLTDSMNVDTLLYPKTEQIFEAFKFFNIKDTKLVILGMDPYPASYANGLAFSVAEGTKIPASLKNIFKELQNEGLITDSTQCSGDLTFLAKQGVLLMNTALTIENSSSGSHCKLWKPFSEWIVKYLSENVPDIVFILMGEHAKKKNKFIAKGVPVVTSAHPSPLSAKLFFGSGVFAQANNLLKKPREYQTTF